MVNHGRVVADVVTYRRVVAVEVNCRRILVVVVVYERGRDCGTEVWERS